MFFFQQLNDPSFGIGVFDYIADTLEMLGAERSLAETDAQDMLDLNEQIRQVSYPCFAIALWNISVLIKLLHYIR